jgi:hypothetical protein
MVADELEYIYRQNYWELKMGYTCCKDDLVVYSLCILILFGLQIADIDDTSIILEGTRRPTQEASKTRSKIEDTGE